MPAVTLGQLQTALGTQAQNSTYFIEPGASFTSYVNELGPRIYSMGPWRDLLTERTHLGADGYISLDRDVEAVWAANVNDSNQRVRSMFHDMRFLGNSQFLPERYGLVDMGEYTAKRDFASIQNITDLTELLPVTTLYLRNANDTAVTSASIAGVTITVVGRTADGVPVTGSLDLGDTNAFITFATGISEITSIIGTGLTFPIDLRTAPTDADTTVAELRIGTDVVRYRRFRVGGAFDSTYVHLLVKRGWVPVNASTNLIYLGNTAAWKHALLGKVAEDNADIERGEYHWTKVQKILDDELASYRGAAKPVMVIDLYGGAAAGIHNLL